MGVKGLQTLMKENNLLTKIDLRRKVREYKQIHGLASQEQVTIVVDRLPMYDNLTWIYGGQWYELKTAIQDCIKKFENIGVKLVFFFDGSVENTKRKTWVERRMRELDDYKSIFDSITLSDGHVPMSQLSQSKLPPNMKRFVMMLLKYELGQTVMLSVGDGDRAIAEYAIRNKCLAILADDTDFVIFNSVPWYSASMLDIEHMTTSCFSQEKLCQYLKIDVMYLPVLAALSGNDLINPKDLKPVTARFKRISTWVIVNVANFLNKEHYCSRPSMDCKILSDQLEKKYPTLKALAFSDCVQSYLFTLYRDEEDFIVQAKKKLRTSKLSRIPQRIFDQIIIDHIYCKVFRSLLGVATGEDADVSTSLEDGRRGLRPYGDVFMPIRSKEYGLVLQVTANEAKSKSVSVNEWNMSSTNPNKEYEPAKVYPEQVLVDGSACDLEKLWFESSEEHRKSIFFAIMGLPPQSQREFPVDSDMYCPIAVIHYLYRTEKCLQPWEVNVLLVHMFGIRKKLRQASAVLKTHHSIHKAVRVNGRGVNIPTLLLHGVGYAVSTLAVCRLQIYIAGAMPWNYFDGYKFHELYVRANDNQQLTVEQLAENDADIVQDVKKCIDFIGRTT